MSNIPASGSSASGSPASNISSLAAQLCSDNHKVRLAAAESLGKLGPQCRGAAIALVRAAGDSVEEIRAQAVAALEEMGPPSVDDLAELVSLAGDRNHEMAYWAATLLGRLRGAARDAVTALATVVASASDAAVRERAAWALGEIGPEAAAALPALEGAAKQASPRLARLATAAIAAIKS